MNKKEKEIRAVLHLICPTCKSKKDYFLKKDEEIIEKIARSTSGLINIYVPLNTVCAHEFHVYLDKNLSIRDYGSIDVSIKIKKFTKEEINEKAINLNNDQILLITLYFTSNQLAHLIKSILLKKKSVMLIKNVNEHAFLLLNQFLKEIFKDTFIFEAENIIFENEDSVDLKKYDDDYYIIFGESGKSGKNKFKTSTTALIFEFSLISVIYSNRDLNSLLNIREEIKKLCNISQKIHNILNVAEKLVVKASEIRKIIKDEKLMDIIEFENFDAILNVLENYFNIKIKNDDSELLFAKKIF